MKVLIIVIPERVCVLPMTPWKRFNISRILDSKKRKKKKKKEKENPSKLSHDANERPRSVMYSGILARSVLQINVHWVVIVHFHIRLSFGRGRDLT